MKKKRQAKILELIENHEIETQEELQQRLIDSGFDVTQATVSRDIREMGIVKTNDAYGKYCYKLHPRKESDSINERLARIFSEAAKVIDYAGNLVVVRSYVGMGSAIGAAIDAMQLDGVLGTLAGDDTLLIIVRTSERAEELCNTLNTLLKTE